MRENHLPHLGSRQPADNKMVSDARVRQLVAYVRWWSDNGRDGVCWKAQASIASWFGWSLRSTHAAVKAARERRWIRVAGRYVTGRGPRPVLVLVPIARARRRREDRQPTVHALPARPLAQKRIPSEGRSLTSVRLARARNGKRGIPVAGPVAEWWSAVRLLLTQRRALAIEQLAARWHDPPAPHDHGRWRASLAGLFMRSRLGEVIGGDAPGASRTALADPSPSELAAADRRRALIARVVRGETPPPAADVAPCAPPADRVDARAVMTRLRSDAVVRGHVTELRTICQAIRWKRRTGTWRRWPIDPRRVRRGDYGPLTTSTASTTL